MAATDLSKIVALLRAQRRDEALTAVEAARAVMPDDLRLAVQHAVVLRMLGRPAEGVAILDPLLAGAPGDLRLRDELTFCLRLAGDTARSLALCEATLATHPTHRPALQARVEGLLRAQRRDEALAAVEAARAVMPDDLRLAVQHASVLRHLGRPAEGAAILDPLLAGAPGDLRLRDELTFCLRLAGDTARSLALCEATLATHPTYRPALQARIEALLRAQRRDDALAAVEAARAVMPDDLRLAVQHASVLRHLGRPAEGAAILDPLLAGAPADLRLRDELTFCLRLAGDTARSLALSEDTLATHPTYRPALQARVEALVVLQDHQQLAQIASSIIEAGNLAGPGLSEQNADAEILVRLLVSLRADDGPRYLAAAAAMLIEAAPSLPSELLWSLYRTADQCGLGQTYGPVLVTLLGRSGLPVDVCADIARSLHRSGEPDWHLIALGLTDRLLPADRWHFDLVVNELAGDAAAALAARKQARQPDTSHAAFAIGQLLRQAGRNASGVRFVRRARRTWPSHPGLFRLELDLLIESGNLDEVRQRISEVVADDAPVNPAALASAVRALVMIGDLDRTNAVMEKLGNAPQRASLERDLFSSYLRRGNVAAAAALEARVRKTLPRRSALHFGPGLNGTVMTDLNLAGIAKGAADPRTFLPVAGAIVASWLESNPSGGQGARTTVPAKVMQYWDKESPPDSVAELMRGWQNLPGVENHRFDRRGAMEWLSTRLDDSWRRALRAARSPAEESDLFRLAWLMLEGGLYVDCDDRRTGDLAGVFARSRGLTVFAEPQGSIANNVILASPLHPAIIWAAHAARRALLEGHSDNTWIKTGPGLLTRAVAWYVSEGPDAPPDLAILPRWTLGSWVQIHVRLAYKSTSGYWNAGAKGEGRSEGLADFARRLLVDAAPGA